jgi:hypothetical protein
MGLYAEYLKYCEIQMSSIGLRSATGEKYQSAASADDVLITGSVIKVQ